MSWRPLGSVLPTSLGDARVELHWAAQLVSAPGTTLLPADPGYEHTNLGWDSELGVLAGRHVGDPSLRAALVFEALELAVLEGDTERGSLALGGVTLKRASAWLADHFGVAALSMPSHDMPTHPVQEGAPFSEGGAGARAELATWFTNASEAIRHAVEGRAGASLVRCWPHHFDVASLVTLDPGHDAEAARSIGVGFSPGDGSYAQPYFYVTPWPYPQSGDLLPLLPAGAHWHTEGWTGAVLPGESILAAGASQQAAVTREVLAAAIEACRTLLGD